MKIIVTGNPVGGFEFFGPFGELTADINDRFEGDWWVVELNPISDPEEDDPGETRRASWDAAPLLNLSGTVDEWATWDTASDSAVVTWSAENAALEYARVLNRNNHTDSYGVRHWNGTEWVDPDSMPEVMPEPPDQWIVWDSVSDSGVLTPGADGYMFHATQAAAAGECFRRNIGSSLDDLGSLDTRRFHVRYWDDARQQWRRPE